MRSVQSLVFASRPSYGAYSWTARNRRTPNERSRGRRGAQHALQIWLHRLQLAAPVAPAVRAVRREVEHTVRAARREVPVLKLLVRPDGQALEELRGDLRIAETRIEVGRITVTAIHPNPGAAGD